MENFQLRDRLRESQDATAELYHLLRSVRAAAEAAEHTAFKPDASLLDVQAICAREAAKLRLLAARMAHLTAETPWLSAEEIAALGGKGLSALAPIVVAGEDDFA